MRGPGGARAAATPVVAGGGVRFTAARWAVLALLLPAVSACSPTMTFAARPHYLCAGQAATLEWDTSGESILVAEPPAGELGRVGNHEARRITLTRTTTFTLTARRGGNEVSGRQEIVVVETATPQPLQVDAKTCQNGAVVFETEVPAERWPAIVRVGDVALSTGQPVDLVIEHEGKTATIRAGQTATSALAGAPVTGRWRATLATASCDAAPDALVLSTRVACAP